MNNGYQYVTMLYIYKQGLKMKTIQVADQDHLKMKHWATDLGYSMATLIHKLIQDSIELQMIKKQEKVA